MTHSTDPPADASMDNEPELLERLFQLPPGAAFLYHRPNTNNPLVWVLRDETQHLEELSNGPLTFRAGAFCTRRVGSRSRTILPVAVLLCLGPECEENIYEYWINPRQETILQSMLEVSTIGVRLYDEDFTLVRERDEPNVLKNFAQETLNHLQSFEPWETQHYRQARRKLEDRYADSWSLWKGLEENDAS